MARAAFLMDRLMARVGLSGRSFIPLLSSFACAIPGIMATRSDRRSQGPADHDPDRAADDLFGAAAGLCGDHRRLHPGAARSGPGIGPAGAGAVRALCRRDRRRDGGRAGAAPLGDQGRGQSGFIMELPKYQLPRLHDLAIGLWQRAWIFLRRAGTIIFIGHRRAVAAAQLPQAPSRAKARSMPRSPGSIANGLRRGGRTDRLQPRYRAGADPGDGRARSRGLARWRPPMRSTPTTRTQTAAGAGRPACRRAGACRPRSPSSPGSCSRRNACRPSPSPGARPMGGNGRRSCWSICSRWPICSPALTYWMAVALGCSRSAQQLRGAGCWPAPVETLAWRTRRHR